MVSGYTIFLSLWTFTLLAYGLYTFRVLFGPDICECKSTSDINKTKPRLLNGSPVKDGDLLFVASHFLKSLDETHRTGIKTYVYRSVCTGIIISDRWVMTAANCFAHFDQDGNYKKYNFIAAGPNHDLDFLYKNEENYRTIKNHHKHPAFNGTVIKSRKGQPLDAYLNDIGLIELQKPFILGHKTGIFPACLLDQKVDDFGKTLLIAGYGRLEPAEHANESNQTEIQEIEVFDTRPKVSHSNNKLLMTTISYFTSKDKDVCDNKRFICGRSENRPIQICLGDAGGPMTWFDANMEKLFVIGVISRAKNSQYDDHFQCNDGLIVRSTPISQNLEWIGKHIREKDRCLLGAKKVDFRNLW